MAFERKPNRALEKFREGKVAYGMQSYIHDPRLYEVAGWAGMDFCMIDMEHCRLDFTKMTEIIRVCEMTDMTPVVRVPENSKTWIRYALEAGARMVVVAASHQAKQSSWNRFWTGRILYKTHPAFISPIILKPSKRNRVLSIFQVGAYQIAPNPMPGIGSALIIDVAKNLKINVN